MAGIQVTLLIQVIGDFARRFTEFLNKGSHSLCSNLSLGVSEAKIQDLKFHIKRTNMPVDLCQHLLFLIGFLLT